VHFVNNFFLYFSFILWYDSYINQDIEENCMKKIMGIDYGDARTGVALSDLLCTIVGSTTVVPSRNTEKAIADIVRIARDNMVGEIVVGLPRNMDGTEGPRAVLCREFADKLHEATGLPIVMWDERRTTVEAHNILSQHNYHGKKRKETVDAVAASLILEGYLNSRK
jgi:putative Holliday junction resolvase